MIYRFGTFELDAFREELRREGRRILLPPQKIRVLLHLVSRYDQLVTRAQLKQLLWPDDEGDWNHRLTGCVAQLRLVLADAARHPRFIDTYRGRGYRFIASVQAIPRAVRDEIPTPSSRDPSDPRETMILTSSGSVLVPGPHESFFAARERLTRAGAELDRALDLIREEIGLTSAILSARSLIEVAQQKLESDRPTVALPRSTLELDRPKS